MILFFDTETTGLPRNYNAPVTDINNWPRMVQLAFIKSDWEGNIITKCDSIIKPEGYIIPKEATKTHGITNDIAIQTGKDLAEVLELFNKEIEEAHLLVAHNFNFDKKIIGAEFFRKKIKSSLQNKTKICTMESGTNFCAIPGGYKGYKWPKLSELHYKLFKENFQEHHNAKHDILATYKCFWELSKRSVIRLSKPS